MGSPIKWYAARDRLPTRWARNGDIQLRAAAMCVAIKLVCAMLVAAKCRCHRLLAAVVKLFEARIALSISSVESNKHDLRALHSPVFIHSYEAERRILI